MNLSPVIERELRAEARHSSTYWLRPVGAGAVLLGSASALLLHPVALGAGGELFGDLHKLLFATIWLLVPLMTSDCVSREKRENTLGLLFLTPLKAGEIMVAKAFVQGLRSGIVCVAALPPLLLPLLLGGVDWQTAAASVLINASAFLWALAAGLLASTLCRTIVVGLAWALVWASVFLVLLSMLHGLAVVGVMTAATGRSMELPPSQWLAGVGLVTLWSTDAAFYGVFRRGTVFPKDLWLGAAAIILVISFVGLVGVWRLSAWRLKNAWQEMPLSKEQERLVRRFFQPRFFLARFRARMRRQIERNPIGWLERRHWLSRTSAWGWLAIIVLIFSFSPGWALSLPEFTDTTILILLGMAGSIALSSSASLRRERESGVMELLLTTPLTPQQIVSGRLRGIWRQFLPVMAFVWIIALLIGPANPNPFIRNETWSTIGLSGLFYLTVPVVGLWFSLRSRYFITALISTIAMGVILPWVGTVMGIQVIIMGLRWSLAEPLFGSAVGSALVGAWLLRRTLGWPGLALVMGSVGLAAWGVVAGTVSRGLPRNWFYEAPLWVLIFLAGQLLLLAGVAHARLLRRLHERRFSYQA